MKSFYINPDTGHIWKKQLIKKQNRWSLFIPKINEWKRSTIDRGTKAILVKINS